MPVNTFLHIDQNTTNALREGDLKAYNLLFKKYYAWLCNYILKISKDRNLSEDIVQEAFIKLWDKRADIKPEVAIGNYLLKICYNGYLQHLKKKKKEIAILQELTWDTFYELRLDEEPETSRIDILHTIIDQLPPRCKEAFVFSKYKKLKYQEIAEIMGISKKTVEIHISKAYAEIREKMKYQIE